MAFRQFTPDEWVAELMSGLDFRRKFGLEASWGEMESIYYNVHPSMANDGPNIIMSTGDSLLSTLTVPKPRVLVKPGHKEAVDKVRLVETLDNLLLRELNVREEVDTIELHAYLFGNGIAKIGYDSEFGYNPDLDIGGALRFGFSLTQLNPQGTRRIEHDSGVAPGMPWISAVMPHDIIVPWGTMRLSKCPWICHRFVRHIDDLKADPKYKNTSRLTPTLSMEDFVGSYRSIISLWNAGGTTQRMAGSTLSKRGKRRNDLASTRDVSYVELYEIHDRRTGRILVIAPGHPSFLRNDINALQIQNRLPFIGTSFTPKSRSFWTTSDAYYLLASQMELSDIAVQRTKIRRIAVVKFLYDKEVIDDEQLNKLLSPDVGAAAAISSGQDINKAILPVQTQPDRSLIDEEEHIRRNTREQVGFSRNQLGEFASGRKTATEVQKVDQASARRLSRRGLAIKKLYEGIIETINGIVFEQWTAPRFIEVLGEQSGSEWVQITGPQLKSRFAYEVIFTDDEELRQRRLEALNMYITLSQDPSIDPAALRLYISNQLNDPEFSRIFNADIQNAMQILRLQSGVLTAQGANNGSGTSAGVSGPQGGTGPGSSNNSISNSRGLALGGLNT